MSNPALAPATPLPPAGRHWWEHPLRIIQLNLIVPDAERDGAQMARRAHEYGANAVLINAGGIYAFYPTEVPFHCRAPGLSGDLLGDAISISQELGMRVIVRYDLIGLHRDAYEAHPEWFYRSHDGRPMVDKGLYMTCPNGGWWQKQFFALWDELAARYRVDGLFFNAWGHKESTREGEYFGPCHCPTCTRLFAERYGRPLPSAGGTTDPVYWLNREFRQQTLDDLGRRIYRYVKRSNPEVALFAGAGHRALVSGQADCTEIELHCGSTAVASGSRWRHSPGESCKEVASLGPGFASGINAVYCHVGPGRWRLSAAPPGWLGYTLAQTIANAGWPYCMMIGTIDTQEDRTSLRVLRDLFTFARDHEDTYRDLQSAARIGLLYSRRTATAAPGWTDTTDRYIKHFRGWYDLLTRKHRLFDVLSDAQLEGAAAGYPGQRSAEALRACYDLLVLPNAARLAPAAAHTLDAYVALGGRLLATGAPPLGADGLRSLGASDVTASREGVSNSYFRVREADRTASAPPAPPAPGNPAGDALRSLAGMDVLPVEGRVWHVQLRPGAAALLGLIPAEDYGAPEQTYFTIETDHPGLIWHAHGSGLTTYLPWEPDRAWFDTGVEALGLLLDGLVGALAPAAAVACDAPEAIELTAHHQRETGRLVVHLVNGSGGTPPRWSEPVPVRDVTVQFRWDASPDAPPPLVRAARAATTLQAQRVDGAYAVTVPELRLFELLTVAPGIG